MNLESIQVDPTLLSGVWWDFHTKEPCQPKTKPHESHFCVLVAPYGHEHQRVLDELRLPHIEDIRRNKGRLPDDIAASIRGTALARTVLKGWANAELAGEPLPFSVAKAEEMLSSPRWTILRQFVEAAASNEFALLMQEEAAAAGN